MKKGNAKRAPLEKGEAPSPKRAARKLTVGSVTIESPVPSQAEIRKNIAAGQAAMRRLSKAFDKPGVNLEHKKGVPLFHADPDDPNILVRILDGERVRGTFVGGKFVKAGKAPS